MDVDGVASISQADTLVPLLELSHELLQCIASYCDATDLASLCATNRALYNFIRNNRLLHKAIYLARYDEPKEDLNWEEALHGSVRLEKILDSNNRDTKRDEQEFVSRQACLMIERANADDPEASRNVELLAAAFDQTDNMDVFLCASSMFGRPGAGNGLQQPARTTELQQASAKLHSLYGVPIDAVPSRSSVISQFRPDAMLSPSACTRSQSQPLLTHTFARSKVYDLREYTLESQWGPFRSDGTGRVDWEKVEAIMIVLGFNLRKFTHRSDGRFPFVWDRPFVGAAPGSYRSAPKVPAPTHELQYDDFKGRQPNPNLEARDPYGVTGTWMRVVCFLDYNDLHAFNFSEPIPNDQLREPIDTEEGLIDLEERLQVERIVVPGVDDEDDEDEEDDGMDWSGFTGPRWPIVYFRGFSRSLHASWDPNANSRIRGSVRTTPEGEIRWTTFSIFHGTERWRSEGVQVGGLRSGRGVLGNWFDKDYDNQGPAGPTAFWKESDELEENVTSGMPLAYF